MQKYNLFLVSFFLRGVVFTMVQIHIHAINLDKLHFTKQIAYQEQKCRVLFLSYTLTLTLTTDTY